MKRLRSCEGCERHVYETERVCPFCETSLAPLPEPGVISIPAGASRAQRLALAAALGSTSLLACSESASFPLYGLPVSGQTASAGTAAPSAGQGGVNTPVYGAPVAGQTAPDDDAGVPEAGGAAAGSGGRG